MIGLLALLCVASSLSAPEDNDRCFVIYEPYGKDNYYLIWFEDQKF